MQEVVGCDALPSTCSATCAPLLIAYFEGCRGIIDDLAPDERQGFQELYGNCQEVEQATAAMLQDAKPAMMFHVVVMNEAAAQHAQSEMFGGGGLDQSFGPPLIGPKPAPSPSPSPSTGGAEAAQEFRRVCSTADLATCVPQCNSLTYGFLLSIEIDGRGTVMTCNVMNMLYAWVGQASLGGYIGSIFEAFFSLVVSGAAGTYMVTVTENEDVRTELTIRPGQVVVINGDRSLQHPPTRSMGGAWTEVEQIDSCELANDGNCGVEQNSRGHDTGDCVRGTDDSDSGMTSGVASGMRAFTVGEAASLSLAYIQLESALRAKDGGLLTLSGCVLAVTATVTVDSAGSLLANLALAGGSLTVSNGGRLTLEAVSVAAHTEWAAFSGTVTRSADHGYTNGYLLDPPDSFAYALLADILSATSCDSGGSVTNLAAQTSPLSADTSGHGDHYNPSCSWPGRSGPQTPGQGGPDALYGLVLGPGQTLEIGLDSVDYATGHTVHELSWGGGCCGEGSSGGTVVACEMPGEYGGNPTSRHSWTNDQGAAEPVYFAVDGYHNNNHGPFVLSWSVT
jgi:hypothetical protein